MIKTWLRQWNNLLSETEDEHFYLRLEGRPEILIEKVNPNWLLIVNLGIFPETLSLGATLQILAANGPYAPFAPLKLTADQQGELLLYASIDTESDNIHYWNECLEKLCDGYAFYCSRLQARKEDLGGARLLFA